MGLPRFLSNLFKEDGYEIFELKEWLLDGRVEVHLGRRSERPWICHHCKEPLGLVRGKHRLRLEGMPILGMRFYIHLWRQKGECKKCKKVSSEDISFIADESPHLTKDYAWWMGRLCEITAVSRVAELLSQDETTTWRMDLARMQKMLESYKIPKVFRISVDEVYARKKPKNPEESRNQRFFTIITDLNTHKVIWVTDGRDESSLSLFFEIIGKSACAKIEVVAADQHEAYARAVAKHCPNATLVWDRFHVMQNFEKVLNEERKKIHAELEKNTEMSELTRGKHRFIFLKKASRRTVEEVKHIDLVMKDNASLLKLELIKERMMTFFDQADEYQGRMVFHDVGGWIIQGGFTELKKWYWKLEGQWSQLANYFKYRVTSAVSEGINNVIKSLKRRAFGYKNMTYFKLKIMQVCGYLNSRFITPADSITCT